MKIAVNDRQGVVVISLTGELASSNSSELIEVLDPLVAEGRREFVIDLSGVSFIDSAGLASLIRCFKHARGASGSLSLAGLQPPVRRVFEITRLDRVFDIYADTYQAVGRTGNS